MVRTHYNYIYNKLKIIDNKEGFDINQGFINRLKHRIYSWYVDSDFLLLKFMWHIRNVYFVKKLIMDLNM